MKLRRTILIGLAITPALTSAPVGAQITLSGTGWVKDGDSLMVGDTEVRLFGVDAPELSQTCQRGGEAWACGRAAAEELGKLIAGQQVRCQSMGSDQYQRVLGRCTASSIDINRLLVSRGYAVAFRRYSSDYVSAEESAKANKRGLWAGSFQMPSEYRHATPAGAAPRAEGAQRVRAASTASRASSTCNIKGNRNRKGQWIYHVPGMPYYERTRPEEVFCTEADAKAAGYRRAIVK
jgi:endonuclease YncB( thermonuclease family)